MTMRLTIGVDPGQAGAIAFLHDGEFMHALDMPTVARKAGGEQVEAALLASAIRAHRALFPGAHTVAVLEQVSAMPGQGGSSMFRFGESYGVARGVLGALGIPVVNVLPLAWKKHAGIAMPGAKREKHAPAPTKEQRSAESAQKRANKDLSRGAALRLWPALAEHFATKGRGQARADAALMARWAWETGRHAEVA